MKKEHEKKNYGTQDENFHSMTLIKGKRRLSVLDVHILIAMHICTK